MITPHTERQKTLIVNNIVRACEDISWLNRTGYKFIYLASGFIAHYDIYGFAQHYAERGKLARAILLNAENNQWYNFSPTDKNYDYYMSKRDIYNRIVRKLLDQGY